MTPFYKEKKFIIFFILNILVLLAFFFIKVPFDIYKLRTYLILLTVSVNFTLVCMFSLLSMSIYNFLSLKLYGIRGNTLLIRNHFWFFVPIHIFFNINVIFKLKYHLELSTFYALIISALSIIFYWKQKDINLNILNILKLCLHYALSFVGIFLYSVSVVLVYSLCFAMTHKILGAKITS